MRPIDADAALKALRKCQTYLYDARDPELKIKLSSAKAAINNLPTIQPEKAQLSHEGTTKDAISRQQALDAVGKYASVWMEYTDAMSKDEIAQIALNNAKSTMIRILKELPTVQPEPTDINAKEAVYNLAEKIGIHQLFALTVELRGEPIQPEPQWIPISDRLPRDGTWNIFTDGKNISVERYKADAIDHFFPNGRWFQLEDVIAWMPLPEPYTK